jgi:hypothetical protein
MASMSITTVTTIKNIKRLEQSTQIKTGERP